MADSPPAQGEFPRVVNRTLEIAEDFVYILVAAVLIVGAIAVLVGTCYSLVTNIDDGVQDTVSRTLDDLLLVFILVELIGAIRVVVRERKLVGEPFLVVGMIASIKEIVVIAVSAKKSFGTEGDLFVDSMTEIGVLGGLLLILGLTILLLRRKEREPSE